ncbi:MAG: ABC transporter ATP-binding protein [Proteobacteria bacterium]|nr:ABC transporter ATP-binding protein [Pseudomonadota bacterium]
MSEPALSFRQVSVRYAPDQAPSVSEVSFSVASGERVALLGLNGSGKTTVLLAAVGLVPHAGEIVVGGLTLTRRTHGPIRERLGFVGNVPEDQLLWPTVLEDTAFALLRSGVEPRAARARALAVLGALGVADLADAGVHRLSHGQKQRVALAGALVGAPPLLLLDEPSAGLDPPSQRALIRVLAALEAAMLVATHDLPLADSLCTRFLVIDHGRIVFDGGDPTRALQRWAADDPPAAPCVGDAAGDSSARSATAGPRPCT